MLQLAIAHDKKSNMEIDPNLEYLLVWYTNKEFVSIEKEKGTFFLLFQGVGSSFFSFWWLGFGLLGHKSHQQLQGLEANKAMITTLNTLIKPKDD